MLPRARFVLGNQYAHNGGSGECAAAVGEVAGDAVGLNRELALSGVAELTG
jgi:hypothetical protein